jgi:hypothetical protein
MLKYFVYTKEGRFVLCAGVLKTMKEAKIWKDTNIKKNS